MRVINLSFEGRGYVSEFMDTQTGVFHEEAFRHLLTREAGRATRYQDFFSICVLRPDVPGADREQMGREVERAISEKIPEFVRATDLVGQLSSAIAVILLHTAGADALRVAERIRANIEQVAAVEPPMMHGDDVVLGSRRRSDRSSPQSLRAGGEDARSDAGSRRRCWSPA